MSEPESELREETPFNATITLLIPKEKENANEHSKLKYFETFVSLAKALAWPLTVLFLFLVLQSPITATLSELPKKIRESTKFTAWNLSFEVQRIAEAQNNPELARIIGDLSPEAIEHLLNTGKSHHILVAEYGNPPIYSFQNEKEMAIVKELMQKGIVEFESPLDEFETFVKGLNLKPQEIGSDEERLEYAPSRPLTEQEKQKLRQQDYHLTDLGKKAFDLIVQAVVKQYENPTPQDTEGHKPIEPNSKRK